MYSDDLTELRQGVRIVGKHPVKTAGNLSVKDQNATTHAASLAGVGFQFQGRS
jgi:hypothetical protein